jgi:hypothetical protein
VVLTAHKQCASVATTLNPGTATATATIADATIGVPGLPVIAVTQASATSISTCGSASGTVALNLTVGGVTVAVPAGPNRTITLSGGARLVVNEQLPVADADYGLTVNAIHLTALDGTVDIVIASATTGMHNCVPATNVVPIVS